MRHDRLVELGGPSEVWLIVPSAPVRVTLYATVLLAVALVSAA